MSFEGYHHTEEIKTKLRLLNKGNKYNLGHHPTEETRARMSQSQLGRTHSEETKEKMRQAKIGKPRSEETRAKLRQANLGKTLSPEHRAKFAYCNLGRKFTKEHRSKLRGEKSELTRWKMSQAQMGNTKCRGIHHSAEFRVKRRQDMKKRWQNPEYKDKVLKASMLGRFIHPNKPESLLLELLESTYPSEWKFVGDGQLIIAGRNPDFWNGDHKLLEMWGDYWHKGEDPQERIDLFRRYGYNTLIIWECELKYPDKVLEKIAEFIKIPLRAE